MYLLFCVVLTQLTMLGSRHPSTTTLPARCRTWRGLGSRASSSATPTRLSAAARRVAPWSWRECRSIKTGCTVCTIQWTISCHSTRSRASRYCFNPMAFTQVNFHINKFIYVRFQEFDCNNKLLKSIENIHLNSSENNYTGLANQFYND